MERKKVPCGLNKDDSAYIAAQMFLLGEGYRTNYGFELVYYQKDFYSYEGTHYKKIRREVLELEVLKFLQGQKENQKKWTSSYYVKNVVLNISALVKIPDETIVPSFLKTKEKNKNQLISLKNGIFNLNRYIDGRRSLYLHTPDFFSINSLPFEYDPKATCPAWNKFTNEALPKQLVNLLQEWFGYSLILAQFATKLTFATNVVPRFSDTSDGIWRRVIFIPFNSQVLDPKKQNRNFVVGSWWVNSGEMNGILNWALKGLARLSKRGYFIEPQISIDMNQEYKDEANPAAVFILENYEIFESGNTCSDRLYLTYSEAIRAHGGDALGKNQFTREVKKIFPTARLSKNAKAIPLSGQHRGKSRRARVWENIRRKK